MVAHFLVTQPRDDVGSVTPCTSQILALTACGGSRYWPVIVRVFVIRTEITNVGRTECEHHKGAAYQSSYLTIVTALMSVLGWKDDTVNMIYCGPDKELCHTLCTL